MFHGDQSIRRVSSSSLIRHLVNFVDEIDEKIIFLKNLYFCLLDNVSGRIECKLGPFSNCMAISHSEELRQMAIRQHVNFVDELTKKLFF